MFGKLYWCNIHFSVTSSLFWTSSMDPKMSDKEIEEDKKSYIQAYINREHSAIQRSDGKWSPVIGNNPGCNIVVFFDMKYDSPLHIKSDFGNIIERAEKRKIGVLSKNGGTIVELKPSV